MLTRAEHDYWVNWGYFERRASLALKQLGSTPRQVARTLRARGFTGQPLTAESNPLARYLSAVLGVPTEVHGDQASLWEFPGVQVDMPKACRDFRYQFDTGRRSIRRGVEWKRRPAPPIPTTTPRQYPLATILVLAIGGTLSLLSYPLTRHWGFLVAAGLCWALVVAVIWTYSRDDEG